MSASLVGSEMCIRDSPLFASALVSVAAGDGRGGAAQGPRGPALGAPSVSYTHLTLPTICSV
eukprot:8683824-Alexandrium_andersonii.AAC.1